MEAIFEGPTVSKIADALQTRPRERPEPEGQSTLVMLRPGESGQPLFLVHPVLGEVTSYLGLARALASGPPVYGIRAAEVGGGKTLGTVAEVADVYWRDVREVQSHGPYRFAGYSAGGLFAYELARAALRSGEEVAFLGLLDCPTPAFARRNEAHAMPVGQGTQLLPRAEAALGLRDAPAYRRLTNDGDRWQHILALAKAEGYVPPDAPEASLEPMLKAMVAIQDAIRVYAPTVYDGVLDVFASETSLAIEDDPSLGWSQIHPAARVRLHRAQGSHNDLLRHPQVRTLASTMSSAIASAEENVPGTD